MPPALSRSPRCSVNDAPRCRESKTTVRRKSCTTVDTSYMPGSSGSPPMRTSIDPVPDPRLVKANDPLLAEARSLVVLRRLA